MNRIKWVVSLFVLASCTVLPPLKDEPVRHLLESPFPHRTAIKSLPKVAIVRPSLPPYLERNELLTRATKGHLKIHEAHLWSEPLDAAMARVLGESLRRITGSANIQPSKNFIGQDYQALVEIRVERFDASPDGKMILDCTWKLQPVRGPDAKTHSFGDEVSYETSGDAMSQRVQAMNEVLGKLAREIARELPEVR